MEQSSFGRDKGGGLGPSGASNRFEPEVTGRLLVLTEEDGKTGAKMLKDRLGLEVANSSDFETLGAEAFEQGGNLLFNDIGVAVIEPDPDQRAALSFVEADVPGVVVEEERVVYAIDQVAEEPSVDETDFEMPLPIGDTQEAAPAKPSLTQYIQGYRDGIDQMSARLLTQIEAADAELAEGLLEAQALSEAAATWGLQVTRVLRSRYTGRGVRLAVLDTGLDLRHPDFTGRRISSASFIPGEAVQDGNGHGTHCTGTAAGSVRRNIIPRYGIAYEADIFAGKVLSNAGRGADRGILAGIEWAVRNKCRVISMSLGGAAGPTTPHSAIYEAVAVRAQRLGALIVAAAGNDSSRSAGLFRAVSHPANCPSIMAVGAIDRNGRIANFSNRGLMRAGGQVDIAGPGVDVYSSWPMNTRYRRLNGTSMATPHVAGIAALLIQQDPRRTPAAVWARLLQLARRLPIPSVDVGAGLVQAP